MVSAEAVWCVKKFSRGNELQQILGLDYNRFDQAI